MGSVDAVRADLGLLVLYLNKSEARDKICRAIQYGAKYISNGEPGPAQGVDKSTALARKVFRLFKFVNDLHVLISPSPKSTPVPLVLLGKSKNAMMSTYFALDQTVWLGRTGIYKNKERVELMSKLSLFSWLGALICTDLIEISELVRLALAIKRLEKKLMQAKSIGEKGDLDEQGYFLKVKETNERLLSLVKSSFDIVVAVGLLQLAPKTVTPRVTGAFGFLASVITCYQLLPPAPKPKVQSLQIIHLVPSSRN